MSSLAFWWESGYSSWSWPGTWSSCSPLEQAFVATLSSSLWAPYSSEQILRKPCNAFMPNVFISVCHFSLLTALHEMWCLSEETHDTLAISPFSCLSLEIVRWLRWYHCLAYWTLYINSEANTCVSTACTLSHQWWLMLTMQGKKLKPKQQTTAKQASVHTFNVDNLSDHTGNPKFADLDFMVGRCPYLGCTSSKGGSLQGNAASIYWTELIMSQVCAKKEHSAPGGVYVKEVCRTVCSIKISWKYLWFRVKQKMMWNKRGSEWTI